MYATSVVTGSWSLTKSEMMVVMSMVMGETLHALLRLIQCVFTTTRLNDLHVETLLQH